MTHHTDTERAEFERTIGVDYDLTPSTIRQGQYAVPVTQAAWYGWQTARRAPSVPVPQGWKLVPVVANEKMQRAIAAQFNGTAREALDVWDEALAAAPQPPEATVNHSLTVEAAPVQMPEPVAFALEWTFNGEDRGMRLYDDETHCRFDAESDGGVCQPLYTEQQVRELLAAHGIEEPQ